MTFYKLTKDDILHTTIRCFPSYTVENSGDQVTGSVFLERPYLNNDLRYRIFEGFSQKQGGLIQKTGSMSASIDLQTATQGGTNGPMWGVVNQLANYYSIENSAYALTFTGSTSTTVRVITVPEIYYDQKILTGSFTGSDIDAAGAARDIFDNGRGGLYSGSLTGTLVGHIFYNEGIAVITKGDITNFGSVSSTNFNWKFHLKGVHEIPVKVFKCRAPAGELNCTTNPTFYTVPQSGSNKSLQEVVSSSMDTYITKVALFDDLFQCVAIAQLAQPIRKNERDGYLIKLKMDF